MHQNLKWIQPENLCVMNSVARTIHSREGPGMAMIGASLSEPHIDEFAVEFLAKYFSYVLP